MAVAVLVETVGSGSANTYATQAEADQYDDNRPASSGDDWTGASSDAKDEALLWATICLGALVEWTGWRVDATQVLQWPRSGMTDRNDNLIATTTIPQELKNAQAEFARLLIAADLMADDDVANKKIRSLRAGPVALEFGVGVIPKNFPDAVFYLLPSHWIKSVRGRKSLTRQLMRA